MSTPEVLVHHEAGLLAKAVAARLVTRLVDVQAPAGRASLVLTGGGIGTAVLAELAAAPAFSGPTARIQTSRALRIDGRVSVSRVGGGFGAPRTATTGRSSYSAGSPGNSDATWPSGPMPSSRTSNDGTGP